MRKSHVMAGALGAAMCLAGAPAAQAVDINWYGGLGGTFTNIDIDTGGGSFSDSVAGGTVFVGMETRASRSSDFSFGLEIAADYFDEFEDSGVSLDLISASILTKAFLPVTSTGAVRVMGQLGTMTSSVEAKGAGAKADDTGTDFLIGTGLDVRVAPGVRLGLDYRYVFESDVDIHITGLRALYYF